MSQSFGGGCLVNDNSARNERDNEKICLWVEKRGDGGSQLFRGMRGMVGVEVV